MGFSGRVTTLSSSDEAQLQKIDELAVASSPASSSLAALLNTVLGRLGGGTLNFYQNLNSTTTPITLCNISGQGILLGLVALTNNYYLSAAVVTIVQDGVIILNGVSIDSIPYSSAANDVAVYPVPIMLHYNSSLTIKFASSNSYSIGLTAVVITGVA